MSACARRALREGRALRQPAPRPPLLWQGQALPTALQPRRASRTVRPVQPGAKHRFGKAQEPIQRPTERRHSWCAQPPTYRHLVERGMHILQPARETSAFVPLKRTGSEQSPGGRGLRTCAKLAMAHVRLGCLQGLDNVREYPHYDESGGALHTVADVGEKARAVVPGARRGSFGAACVLRHAPPDSTARQGRRCCDRYCRCMGL